MNFMGQVKQMWPADCRVDFSISYHRTRRSKGNNFTYKRLLCFPSSRLHLDKSESRICQHGLAPDDGHHMRSRRYSDWWLARRRKRRGGVSNRYRAAGKQFCASWYGVGHVFEFVIVPTVLISECLGSGPLPGLDFLIFCSFRSKPLA